MSTNVLENKLALITGGSKGLGRAMAVAMAGAGARIALASRDREKLESVAAEVRAAGSEAYVFVADVGNEEDVLRLESDISSTAGKIDILINNAGINIRKNITEFTLEEWNRVHTTNLTSVFLLCRSFIPHMKGKGYGRILNLTSIMSHVSLGGRSAYSSSKTALLGLTRALALELAADAITVNGISPGPFGTEMNTPVMNDPEMNKQFVAKIPLGRWGKVEEVGQLAVYLCSEASGFITGTDILIDGGWCAQ
jgi:NAD(P)-dependent dehydrogenase (short-subunit alcohol dehydrogenase family)